MTSSVRPRLGDLLVLSGKISSEQLNQALDYQKETGARLGTTLVELGFIDNEALTRFLGTQQGVETVEAVDLDVNEEVVTLLNEDFVRRFEVMPLRMEGRNLVIACTNPDDLFLLDEVRLLANVRNVRGVLASQTSIRRAMEKQYSTHSLLEEVIYGGELFEKALAAAPVQSHTEEEPDAISLEADANQNPVISLVNFLLIEAVKRGASDIHIEPYDGFLRVRMRIDGVLHPILTPPVSLLRAIISRLKILAGMDISVSRRPQDGHIAITYIGEVLHYRVSMLPTVYGEKCVTRLMKKEAALLDLQKLGIPEDIIVPFNKVIKKPQGLVLVTGPTGSGKTTTCHAALDAVNDIETNVVTLEDPFESAVPGVNHVQVDNKSGLTFLAGLRSILRQDPDVVFLGEIRDLEVAKTAMEAAMTGHMVFSTLHTNSSIESLIRLEDMGVEGFLIAGTLQAVLAQRLVRRLCGQCKVEAMPPYEELAELGLSKEEADKGRYCQPVGCNHCMGGGFKGRAGVYECFFVTPKIRSLIRVNANVDQLTEAARTEGFRSLAENGLDLVTTGATTVEELLRCVSE